jgi:hypothetical protein
MLDNSDEFRAYATHLRSEHRRLDERLRRVEQRWRAGRPHWAQFAPEAAGDLAELRTELARHFEEEEDGGCLEQAVSQLPTLAPEVGRLEHEHSQLLCTIDRLIERLRRPKTASEPMDEVDEEFRGVVKRLRAHEAAENRILKESFGAT